MVVIIIMEKKWFVYILECKDGTYYTGTSNDVEVRMETHAKGKGSKYVCRRGFKRLFFTGFVILSFISILCFFISNIYVLLSLLVLASVGISMIESTSESYFFDIINEKQRDKYYGVYNTAVDAGFLLGTLPAALLLLFFSFKSVFILFAFFMLLFALLSLKIREVREFRRK